MANLIRRRPRDEGALAGYGRVDPVQRIVRDLFGFDPFRAMERIAPAPRELEFSPDIEVKETADGYVFSADLPGVSEGDVDIAVGGRRLTISGKREEETRDEGDDYYCSERAYGSFTRSFTLPEGADVDNARAELKDGVLSVTVPKRPGAESRKIPLGGGGAAKAAKA